MRLLKKYNTNVVQLKIIVYTNISGDSIGPLPMPTVFSVVLDNSSAFRLPKIP